MVVCMCIDIVFLLETPLDVVVPCTPSSLRSSLQTFTYYSVLTVPNKKSLFVEQHGNTSSLFINILRMRPIPNGQKQANQKICIPENKNSTIIKGERRNEAEKTSTAEQGLGDGGMQRESRDQKHRSTQ